MNKDEALQVIRSNYPTGRNELCEALETLIPELKVNDEQIKEDIISCVNEFWDKLGSVHPEYSSRSEMLTWLEKQGEQKSTIETKVIIPKFRIGDIVRSKSQCTLGQRKIISIDENGYLCDDKGHINFIFENNYEIVEQKHIEWSKEDEETLNSILNDFSQDVIPDDEDIQWLKSIKQRMKG